MPVPTSPTPRRPTPPDDPATAATGADRTIEAELADQPSIIDPGAEPPRRTRAALAWLTAAALAGVIGLTYLTSLGADVESQRDDTSRTLNEVSQATVAACREGVMVPATQGIDACAKAIAAAPGPIDPASVAALVRSIIGVTDPGLRFDPNVIAGQLGALLPQLGAAAIDAVVDAQVAAAQGSARPDDAQAVTEGAITPPPATGAPSEPGPPVVRPAPSEPDRTSEPAQPDRPAEPDRPVDPVEPDRPDPGTVEPTPDPPQATGIGFERDGDGRCEAVTAYSDGTSVRTPADDASCDPVTATDPAPTGEQPGPASEPLTPSEEPAAPSPSESDAPLISVN